MNNVDKQYLNLLQDILDNGTVKHTRAGDTLSVFGRMMRFNLKEGLPLLTTKKVFYKGCIHELLWFLQGNTNIKYLVDNNVHIWDDDAYRWYKTIITRHNDLIGEDENARHPFSLLPNFPKYEIISKEEFIQNVKEEKTLELYGDGFNDYIYYYFGDLGEVYGKQWRSFGEEGIDQIQNIIETLKNNPDDRRMLCVAYNPDVLDKVALPPCHVMFQFYTKELENGKKELNLLWTQRSVDSLLGLPYNILSYAILLSMIAQVVDMEVGELVCSLGDTHIYLNQMDGLKEQMSHDPQKYELPKLELNMEIKNINDFTFNDIKIVGYESYPKIYFPLSVG